MDGDHLAVHAWIGRGAARALSDRFDHAGDHGRVGVSLVIPFFGCGEVRERAPQRKTAFGVDRHDVRLGGAARQQGGGSALDAARDQVLFRRAVVVHLAMIDSRLGCDVLQGDGGRRGFEQERRRGGDQLGPHSFRAAVVLECRLDGWRLGHIGRLVDL